MNTTYEATKAELKKDRPALMAELEAAGVKRWTGPTRSACACPFCDDTNPSAGIYTKNGTEHYNCFSCGFNGDIFDVREKRTGETASKQLSDLARETVAPKALPPTTPPAQPTKPPPPLPPALTIEALSAALGVSVEALDAQSTHRGEGCWRTPERDAQGNVIGHALRLDRPIYLNGKWTSKISEKGEHRGLTMGWPLSEFAGASIDDPIIIIEGATDQAAAFDMGMVGIGRPAAKTGLDPLRVVCKVKHVCIIGENDKKADGAWPGREGAEKMANGLHGIAASVKVIYPPLEVKDLRAWKAAGLTGDQLRLIIDMKEQWKPTGDQASSDTKSEAKPLEIVTASKMIADFPELRPIIIEGTLRETETMNVIASAKVGKTYLALHLALCTATGRRWLGRLVAPGRVLYIDAELHPNTLAKRIAAVASALGIHGNEFTDSLDVLSLRGKLRDIFQLSAFFSTIPKGKYKIIVLDALYRLIPKGISENANEDMTQVYNAIDEHGETTGAAFVVVHHASKGNQSQKSVTDTGSGAGAISRAADSHLILRPHEEDDAVVLESVARSFPPTPATCLRWNYPVWSVDGDLDPDKLRVENRRKPKAEAPPAWTAERFANEFITEKSTEQKAIVAKARGAGLTKSYAEGLLRLAEGEGRAKFLPRVKSTDPQMVIRA